eukprot:scaffold2114_cov253-Pinguiococcus_pyrenoidosus.AAC.32
MRYTAACSFTRPSGASCAARCSSFASPLGFLRLCLDRFLPGIRAGGMCSRGACVSVVVAVCKARLTSVKSLVVSTACFDSSTACTFRLRCSRRFESRFRCFACSFRRASMRFSKAWSSAC